MAKFSIYFHRGLVRTLWAEADGSVCKFAAAIVRNELDRRRLRAFLQELEAELGPADEEEVARFSAIFAHIDTENVRTAASRKARSSLGR